MLTLGLFLLWYFDTNIRKTLTKSSWVIPVILDVVIVVGIVEIINPTCNSIGGILG